jgi:hypothetical protein
MRVLIGREMAPARCPSLHSCASRHTKPGVDPKDLEKQLQKDKIIYTHCVGGARALAAAKILEKLGYNVRELITAAQSATRDKNAPDTALVDFASMATPHPATTGSGPPWPYQNFPWEN